MPAPVDLPLPGGVEHATVALTPLLCAEAIGPPGWFHRESGLMAAPRALGLGVSRARWWRIPIVAFLVEHPGAGPILIDTGLHPAASDDPGQLGPINRRTLANLRIDPEQTVAPQLKDRGVRPEDVGAIVMTHLHFDHASGLGGLPATTVLVSGAEWEAANRPASFLAGYRREHLDSRHRYRTLHFGDGSATSWEAFPQTIDLFGDGSVRLASTPGHTPGHLSLIVRLRDRPALMAGDAIYTMATLREGKRPFRIVDVKAFERSLAALQAFDRDHPDAVIIPGHDMSHWEQLAGRYE
jgi:glyoxylase-like metal-dependent hydrolase (beta-lactamase superfamily II)